MRADPATGQSGPLATADPDGRTLVSAFTDAAALTAWAGQENTPHAVVPGPELARIAVSADAAALWINPAGPHGGRLERYMVDGVAAGETPAVGSGGADDPAGPAGGGAGALQGRGRRGGRARGVRGGGRGRRVDAAGDDGSGRAESTPPAAAAAGRRAPAPARRDRRLAQRRRRLAARG